MIVQHDSTCTQSTAWFSHRCGHALTRLLLPPCRLPAVVEAGSKPGLMTWLARVAQRVQQLLAKQTDQHHPQELHGSSTVHPPAKRQCMASTSIRPGITCPQLLDMLLAAYAAAATAATTGQGAGLDWRLDVLGLLHQPKPLHEPLLQRLLGSLQGTLWAGDAAPQQVGWGLGQAATVSTIYLLTDSWCKLHASTFDSGIGHRGYNHVEAPTGNSRIVLTARLHPKYCLGCCHNARCLCHDHWLQALWHGSLLAWLSVSKPQHMLLLSPTTEADVTAAMVPTAYFSWQCNSAATSDAGLSPPAAAAMAAGVQPAGAQGSMLAAAARSFGRLHGLQLVQHLISHTSVATAHSRCCAASFWAGYVGCVKTHMSQWCAGAKGWWSWTTRNCSA